MFVSFEATYCAAKDNYCRGIVCFEWFRIFSAHSWGQLTSRDYNWPWVFGHCAKHFMVSIMCTYYNNPMKLALLFPLFCKGYASQGIVDLKSKQKFSLKDIWPVGYFVHYRKATSNLAMITYRSLNLLVLQTYFSPDILWVILTEDSKLNFM